MTLIWLSQLILELAVSISLRTYLSKLLGDMATRKIINNNYSISISKKLLTGFIINSYGNVCYIHSSMLNLFSSRESVLEDIEMVFGKSLSGDLEEILSLHSGNRSNYFDEKLSKFKKARHAFRRGSKHDNITRNNIRSTTFEYLQTLSVVLP